MRLDQCDVEVSEKVRIGGAETLRRVPLHQVVQEGWVHELQRGQPRVVDRFLRRRCEEAGVVEVTLSRLCRATDGTPEPLDPIVRACGASP